MSDLDFQLLIWIMLVAAVIAIAGRTGQGTRQRGTRREAVRRLLPRRTLVAVPYVSSAPHARSMSPTLIDHAPANLLMTDLPFAAPVFLLTWSSTRSAGAWLPATAEETASQLSTRTATTCSPVCSSSRHGWCTASSPRRTAARPPPRLCCCWPASSRRPSSWCRRSPPPSASAPRRSVGEEQASRAAERRRLIAEQRPRRGRLAAGAAVPQVETAITADARLPARGVGRATRLRCSAPTVSRSTATRCGRC